ncbi:MAG: adenosylmethionine--8-amino-7-oxononanoate transaminase [bacterium]
MEKDKNFLWHPFTQMKDWVEGDEQLIIERGEGIKLYDIDGNSYYDGVSSIWLNVHGHRKKELNQAIIDQLKKVAHSTMLGLSNIPAIELAARLAELTPSGLNKVFFSDNGSTAVEVALKIAVQYWQQKSKKTSRKIKFITLENAYHGDTIGSVSVGAIDLFHKIYSPLLFETFIAPSPYCYRCPVGKEKSNCKMDCINKLEDIMKKNHQQIAAMIIEPLVQGAGGMITSPFSYLARVRELCQKYEILLIADEVAVGFGRTGTMFACEQENVVPDIMTVAKGISGGYLPIAATICQDEIYQAFYDEYEKKKTFFHGHSYTGNPLAAAVSLANIELFIEEKILKNMKEKIIFLKKELKRFDELKYVGDIRQKGLMVGIELVRDKNTKEVYKWSDKIGVKVCMCARKLGLIIRPLGNVIVFIPPLVSCKEEIKVMLNKIYEAIDCSTRL